MTLLSELKVLYHLAAKPVRGNTHAERMENFYAGQADAYDRFRRRLLWGREELYQSIPVCDGDVWVDMGGGTGANLLALENSIHRLGAVYVVDLSDSLLEIARRRADDHSWKNVHTVAADATTFVPDEEKVDVVTFSYSLTMIPDWFAALERAEAMLKSGGRIGVVDFCVSRKRLADQTARHNWWTRSFWPAWFALDDVFLSADHVPFLCRHFDTVRFDQRRARVPYVPLGRVPYYLFIGTKRCAT